MSESLDIKQYNIMVGTPIPRLIGSLAIPAVISMLVTAIYNMADTYFVGRLGPSATAAVGVVFSLQAIIQAVGFMLGMGAGALISRLLGKKENEQATIVANTALVSALIFGVLYGTIGNIFISGFMKLLGASDTILPFANDYARFILFGAPLMAGSFVLNNLLRAEGKTLFSMIGLVTGAIINIALDPVFINEWGLNLGIAGAAIATILSQAVSFFILLSFFLSGKSIVKINPKYISKTITTLFDITKSGLPSFARQALASIASIILNRAALAYGSDAAIAAISITTKLYMFVFSFSLGIGQGFQPVVGYNYSSNHLDRVKKAIYFTYSIMTILLIICAILSLIFSRTFVDWFVDNSKEGAIETIDIGQHILIYNSIIYPLLSLNVISNMTFQSIGMKWKSTLLSTFRQGLFFIPIVLILPPIIGLKGVELAQAIADGVTFLATIPFIVSFMKLLSKKIKEEELKKQEQNSELNVIESN